MEKKIGDQTEDLNIQVKEGMMDFKRIGSIARSIFDTILKAVYDLNEFYEKKRPTSEIIALVLVLILITISNWAAWIGMVLFIGARVAYIKKWLERYLNLNPF